MPTPGNQAGPATASTAVSSRVDTWALREQSQAAAFDAIGDRYDEAFPHKEGQIQAVEGLLRRLRPGARVLDLGCGTGLPSARQLVDGGCEVTGLDLSTGMLDLARRNVPEARLVRADMVDLDPGEQRFDAVIAFFSLLMVPRDHIVGTLELLHHAIAPGGWLCVAMVEADVDDTPIAFLGTEVLVTGYLRDELREVLGSAGFRVEDERAVTYAPDSSDVYPEIQLFLTCRREDRRD